MPGEVVGEIGGGADRIQERLGLDEGQEGRLTTRVTFMRCLKRVVERDYRGVIATACYTHASRGGGLALVLYDLTTLHFETDVEDRLRKVGMSKERRVDPQVTVGLLTTASGFPLEVHLFEGNKGETTTTLIPVLTTFAARHQVAHLVVVADAGMLSASNLLALEWPGTPTSAITLRAGRSRQWRRMPVS